MLLVPRRLLAWFVLLVLPIPLRAVILHRLAQSSNDLWMCSSCKSNEQCCQVLQDHGVRYETCEALIARIPQKHGMFSLYTPTNRPLVTLDGRPVITPSIWETLNATNHWEMISTSPFRGDQPRVHRVESTLSSSGGMHRSWHHILSSVQARSPILLFLFLTEHVFMDEEDIVENIQGATIVRIHTTETIPIESPAFTSRQHAVVIELIKEDEEEDQDQTYEIQLTTKLHLRYLEPSQTSERTTQLQIPHPVLWNSRGIAPDPILIERVATGSAGDAFFVTTVTILSSFVGACLLLLDLWNLKNTKTSVK